jgi:uncharacterized protein
MNAATQKLLIDGAVGHIECALDLPADTPKGLALVAHPHPLQGGTLDNKVAQTLARAFVQAGYAAVRPNFRGVGASLGVHDEGRGEAQDMCAVVAHFQPQFPSSLLLAGFSFGGFVMSHVAATLKPKQLVLVGPAARYGLADVADNTLLIHGEQDDVVPLADVMNWARPQSLPVLVLPGVGHFFHGQLPLLKRCVLQGVAEFGKV